MAIAPGAYIIAKQNIKSSDVRCEASPETVIVPMTRSTTAIPTKMVGSFVEYLLSIIRTTPIRVWIMSNPDMIIATKTTISEAKSDART